MYPKQIKNENSNSLYKEKQKEIFMQKLIILQVDRLQQSILEASGTVKTLSHALSQAYRMLSEEQKIAFILAGGAEQLFHYQYQKWQREQEQRNKTDHSSSDPRTDDLPMLS